MPFGGALTIGAIGAGTSLFGGIKGSNAANKAAQLQAQQAQQAAQIAQTAGTNAQNTLKAATDPAVQQLLQAAGLASSGVTGAAGGVANAAGTSAAGVNAATGQANGTLADVLAQQKGALSPYLALGTEGANTLAAALAPGGDLTKQFSFDPSQIANNPNYQFSLQQGLQAVQRAAAAQGRNISGGTYKSLDQYSQGLATNTLNDAYQQALSTFQTNRNNTLNSLSAAIGFGQTGTNQYLNALQNYGNNASQNTLANAVYGGNLGYDASKIGYDAAKTAGKYGYDAANTAGEWNLRSATQQGNWGLQAAQIVGNDLTDMGRSQAGGVAGSANAWNSAINGIGANTQYALGRILRPNNTGAFGGAVAGAGQPLP